MTQVLAQAVVLRLWQPVVGLLSRRFAPSATVHRKPCPRLQLLTMVNGVFLLLLWSLENFVGERYWLTMLLTYMPQQGFALLAVYLLGWALWRKEKRLIAANLLAFLFCATYLLGYNAHLPWRRAHRGANLRVMTYNINGGSHGAKAITEAVLAVKPTILCLQETKGYTPSTDPVPQLQARLPGWFIARGTEVTTFSRYPIVRQRLYKMPSPSGRVLLAVTVAVRGQPVTIFNIHLSNAAFSIRHPRHFSNRSAHPLWASSAALGGAQVETLIHATEKTREPFIVMGDFNTPPRGLLYRRLSKYYQDAFHAAGRGTGYTFRMDVPIMRIDYVFTHPRIRINDAFVPFATASDHRPLVADLSLPQAP